MRALVAGVTVFLGLGAMGALATTMAGCSDSTDTGGSGGAGGAASGAGAGGASAGTGGDSCAFKAPACTSCLQTKCGDQVTACSMDPDCATALGKLTPCVCGGTDVNTCAGTFATDGGDPAFVLTECYSTMCADTCAGM